MIGMLSAQELTFGASGDYGDLACLGLDIRKSESGHER